MRALARGEEPDWPGLTGEQESGLLATADTYLDLYRKHHLPEGLNADILWEDYHRSSVIKYDGLGDSTTWTGHYLAVLALRYHILREEATRGEILDVLDRFDLLTRVSGRTGYLARYAGRADNPAYEEYYRVYGGRESRERPGLGVRAYWGAGEYAHMVWLGHSSRDTYDGARLGFAVVWVYVDDPEIRARTRQLVERIGDRLVRDNWKILDGQGSHTWHSFRWKLAWMRLLLSVSPERYAPLQEAYDRMVLRFPRSGPSIPGKRTRKYYPANLNFARMFVLATLEDDPEKRDRFHTAIRRAYHEKAGDHLNAHFAALYMAATGDIHNANARATLEGMLCDYPPPPKWARVVDHRRRPGTAMRDADFTKHALLTREQVPRDFLWQRPPCLAYGGVDKPLEYPALDFILPYWLGRVCGALSDPTKTLEPSGH